ncbi:signal peptide peptidase SppA [Halomonas sp. Bachu 37]|uniref:signal peptide peptidase SppA n=1 Tax=Halomonas kashgarensis TaxID=3084920 RepID=UPI003216E768
MSDETPRDDTPDSRTERTAPSSYRWTHGPQVSPASGRSTSSGKAGYPDDDAETLRERQRLAQMEMMDHWIGGVLAEQRRSRRWKLFFRFLLAALILASLSASLYSLFGPGAAGSAVPGPHLAVVEVHGVIAREAPASAERLIEGLRRAWSSETAAAVVLHIDSPGGSPVQSQRVHTEIMRLRALGDKPILAVVEDIGASGAYYIASAADEIIASPASLVGSIGVIYAGFGFEEAIDELGIERRVMTAGEHKAFLDPFQPLGEDERDFWQQVLTDTHQQFIDDVQAGRGERLDESEELFSGLIWSGEQALELGLIDSLGSLEQVARHYLEEPRLEDYTPSLDPFERLTRRFTRTAAQVLGIQHTDSPLRYQLP